MNPRSDDVMKQCTLRLRNADREAFETFLAAFDVYTLEAMEALAKAPQDQILAQQGRVQQCRALLQLFRECHIEKRNLQHNMQLDPSAFLAP